MKLQTIRTVSCGFSLLRSREIVLVALSLAVDPFESGGIVIEYVHGRLAAIEAVQLLHPGLHAAMNLVLQHMPFQAGVVSPLAHLAEFAAHEEQFLAGLRVHVSEQQAQVGELLPFVAGHLADQRSLAVNDFVVRKRQHEIFRETNTACGR